ncbi:hypothetical protein [Myroides fluvii]|uniref:hypothetical protein n=1 Tax=Myroides fluvii TaxID=2572594 RepID=UPI00131C3D45|nr:hypothetical protein [Myroides fluvii]
MKRIHFVLISMFVFFISCGDKDAEATSSESIDVNENRELKTYYESLIKLDPYYSNINIWFQEIGTRLLNVEKGELYTIFERKIIEDKNIAKREALVHLQYLLITKEAYYILVFKQVGQDVELTDILRINRGGFFSSDQMEKVFYENNLIANVESLGKVKTKFYVENKIQYFVYTSENLDETEIITVLDLGKERKF